MDVSFRFSVNSRVWAILAIISAIVMSGCQALKPASFGMDIAKKADKNSADTYTVEFIDKFSRSKPYTGQLSGKPITVQNALEDSGAWRRFRFFDVEIMRAVPDQYKPLVLPVGIQKGKRMVRFEQDYAIHPGDRIVVTAKYPNPFGLADEN